MKTGSFLAISWDNYPLLFVCPKKQLLLVLMSDHVKVIQDARQGMSDALLQMSKG